MISNRTKSYCCDDISLIENYDKAVNDEHQVWECHHRLETDLGLSKQELIDMGLYFNRQASELILLTPEEHKSMHNKGENNPMYGKHQTAEAKAKIASKNSIANKGRTPWNKGKPMPDETKAKIGDKSRGRHQTAEAKAKISAKNKGRVKSAETKAKISAGNKGKRRTAEQKANLSKAHKGENNGNAKPVYQIDKTTGKIIKKWKYAKGAAKALNIDYCGILRCCSGYLKTSGDFIWRYVDDYNSKLNE